MNEDSVLSRMIDSPNDRVGLFGNFGFNVYRWVDGKRVHVRRVYKRNQITNQGRSTVLNLLYPGTVGTAQEEYRVWSLSVGINPTPPTVSDDLATMNPVWTSQITIGECTLVESSPNDFYLQIVKTLPDTAANDQTLTEAGIFTRGDNDDPLTAAGRLLYARQIHPPILKNSNMTIEYDWQLGVTIQGT